MLVRTAFPSLSLIPDRAAVLAQLRGLLARQAGWREDVNATLPFGLAALDSHLPNGGLACGALHEIVPTTQAALPAAFGFVVAILARLSSSYGDGLADSERMDAHCLPHGFPNDPPYGTERTKSFLSCRPIPCANAAACPDMASIVSVSIRAARSWSRRRIGKTRYGRSWKRCAQQRRKPSPE